jgi:hypothetical protein
MQFGHVAIGQAEPDSGEQLLSIVAVCFAAYGFTALLWNVVTVSLRQVMIPDEILGRVNSVYRFLGWGAMPIGTILGGVLASLVEQTATTIWACVPHSSSPWSSISCCWSSWHRSCDHA